MRITLVPRAGLCNRLNAILSGLAYKEKYPNVELTILWHKWFHCNCRFKDLFKQLPSQYPPVQELMWQIKDIPGHKLNFGIPQKLRHLWYDCSILDKDSADCFDELTKGMEKVYVCHANRFCKEETHQDLAKFFFPTDELQNRIDEVTKNWNDKNVIGLHIRRTDNINAINKSPIELFYKIIDEELSKDNDALFYIASDEKVVKETMSKRYGNHIISIPLCLKRNCKQGMKDAVVDLFCLGKTNKIYGSAHSTYSTFAAELFGTKITIVGEQPIINTHTL